MADRYYLTTPIYYVNDRPHIGHAYTTILGDVIARRKRMTGHEVRFLTGTDEHGASVARAAAQRQVEPQTHVDELAPSWKATWDRLEIRYDRFIRTTDADHAAVVRDALTTLRGRADAEGRPLLYEDVYRGWYCVSDERYWTAKDLLGGRCPECGKPVEEIEERNWFFRMSSFQEPLADHIRSHPGFIHPQTRANEILGFLREPLGDLCITRPRERLSWGIPLPWDDSFVTYVWVDALLNYVTGTVDPTGGDAREGARRAIAAWNEHPADVHLLGKDILTTHSVYWITLLMALGWSLPRQILAHGWWLWEGGKMSKSAGNVVRPDDLAADFGVDGLRYYLMREMTLGQDSSYSYDSLVRRLNADLANDLGNLHSRITKMVARYLDGRLPARDEAAGRANEAALRELAERLLADGADGSVSQAWNEWKVHVAVDLVLGLVSATNEYLEAQKPWTRAREADGGTELAAILLHAAEALRLSAVLLWPVVPELAERLLADLGQPEIPRGEHLRWGILDGDRVTSGPALYGRIEAART